MDHTMPNPDNLNVGIEVESPTLPGTVGSDDKYRSWGSKSDRLYRQLAEEFGSDPHARPEWPHGGQVTSDVSVGLEVHSAPEGQTNGGIPVDEAKDWYPETLDLIEEFGTHVPVGKMTHDSQTAGMHIHFSLDDHEAAREFAEQLYDVSQKEWMQVFVGSSIAELGGPTTAEVFRGTRHVSFGGELGHGNVVQRRTPGHYEWRLPEPATRDHFPLVMDYLYRLADEGPDAANEWAKELVYSADSRLTAFTRAEAIGTETFAGSIPALDDYLVSREEDGSTGDFFETVYRRADLPYIYKVEVDDAGFASTYYALTTMTGTDADAAPDGYEHVFPEAQSGDTWVVQPTSDGGVEMASPEDARVVAEAVNTWPDSTEEEYETSSATDVFLEALS